MNADKSQIGQIIKEAIKLRSETSNVEFKDSRGGFPRDAWKTVSSFSHRPNGGYIVFGIMEDRTNNTFVVTGTDKLAILQEKMSDLVNAQMNVVIRPEYFPIILDKKTVLVVYIPECPDQFKPCYYKHVGMPNGAFIRDGNTDRKITDEEMRQFLDNAKLTKFDSTQAPDVCRLESQLIIFEMLKSAVMK